MATTTVAPNTKLAGGSFLLEEHNLDNVFTPEDFNEDHQMVVKLAEERQLRVEERAFSVDEALKAKEAFITSASSFVQAVVSIDGKTVANGKPGPMTQRLREIYVDFAKATGT